MTELDSGPCVGSVFSLYLAHVPLRLKGRSSRGKSPSAQGSCFCWCGAWPEHPLVKASHMVKPSIKGGAASSACHETPAWVQMLNPMQGEGLGLIIRSPTVMTRGWE